MRAIFLILIVAVVALIAAVMSGMIDIRQTQPAVAPGIQSADGKLVTTPGQAPAFDVETGSVGVATGNSSITVPKIEIQPSDTRIGVPSVEVRRPGAAQGTVPAVPPAQAPAPAPAPAQKPAQ